jgi:GNAT superfamily N-acetyltransferase
MSLFFDHRLSLGSALGRARDILQREGLHCLWCKVMDGTIYRRAVLIERPLMRPVAEVATRHRVVIDLMKESNIDEYLRFRTCMDDAPVIRRRIAAGHWCFAARHDGRLIGTLWATTDPQRLLPMAWTPPLRPGEVYVYDLFVTPDARGGRVASKLTSDMLRYFKTAGYDRVVAAVLLQQHSIVRLYQGLGFGLYGRMSCLKIGPWKRRFYHDLVVPK